MSISLSDFQELISNFKSHILVSPHALDQISDAQRSVFNEEFLMRTLLAENPRGIGLQKNGRHAVFYKRKEGFMKIIIEKKQNRLEIITFINVDAMPNLKRLENENKTS